MVECNFAIRRKYKNQDMKYKLIIFVLFLLGGGFTGKAYLKGTDTVVANPLELHFHRLAVRRFIFSNNIPLSEFVPSEIVSFESMHPAFLPSRDGRPKCDTSFHAHIYKGCLVLGEDEKKSSVSFYVGAVNPYATYEIDIHSWEYGNDGESEVGFELARMGLQDRVQLFACLDSLKEGIYLRIYKDGLVEREERFSSSLPDGSFTLRAQLYGNSLGAFIEEYGHTSFLGYLPIKKNFSEVIDFRSVEEAAEATFNVISNLCGRVEVAGARSYLSTGIGQADIRLISYEDLSPYMDQNRLWFTFSCRGIDINQSVQGVLSLDPSVFDIRFEGVIVFDHGDGLLRNDYASHLFYDRREKLWKAYACDFGGTAYTELRSGTGLVTAVSSKDPRRGFSVMKARRVETDHVLGHNEDPCIFYDSQNKKWRLLTSVLTSKSITSGIFESEEWDGKFTRVAPPISLNSTGTSIQKIGGKYYAFMGGHGNLRVHAYPSLELLGELDLDLQPHWPKAAGRVWASLVPLPEGYPYRYVLLTMDRPNFPGITGANWSYGGLYFYGAD